jgi:thymidylate kinase
LRYSIGNKLAQQIIPYAKNANWHNIDSLHSKARIALIINTLLKRTHHLLLGPADFLLGYINAAFSKKSGLFITLIGPDGSGKSTSAKNLIASFEHCFSKTCYNHGHFKILPELKTFKKPSSLIKHLSQKNDQQINFNLQKPENPNPQKPYNIFKAAVYLLYYFLDYLLGHFKILWANAKGDMVIFDRYFYDYIYQPAFKKLPKCLTTALLKLLPAPDIIIYLKCEPEQITTRKPELTCEAIASQQKTIEKLLTKLNHAITINTQKNIDEANREIHNAVIEHLKSKNNK